MPETQKKPLLERFKEASRDPIAYEATIASSRSFLPKPDSDQHVERSRRSKGDFAALLRTGEKANR